MADKIRTVEIERSTKETSIKAKVGISGERNISIETGVPFFDHMLHAFFFHGGFDLELKAKGDIEVEPHHLVEDVGIVLGQAFFQLFEQNKAVTRFASQLIPMDDSLVRSVVDYSARPYLIYRVEYPQALCGTFDISLVKEFFYAFCINGRLNLHLECFYGDNSHHIAEGLFKAAGKSIGNALTLVGGKTPLSTKGAL